jgi:hypothetical protein
LESIKGTFDNDKNTYDQYIEQIAKQLEYPISKDQLKKLVNQYLYNLVLEYTDQQLSIDELKNQLSDIKQQLIELGENE